MPFAYENYVHRLEGNVVNNPKSFWSFINSKGTQTRISAHMSVEQNVLSHPQDIVDTCCSICLSIYIKCRQYLFTDCLLFEVGYIGEEYLPALIYGQQIYSNEFGVYYSVHCSKLAQSRQVHVLILYVLPKPSILSIMEFYWKN